MRVNNAFSRLRPWGTATTSEKLISPWALAASTLSPTATSEIDCSSTDSLPAKQLLEGEACTTQEFPPLPVALSGTQKVAAVVVVAEPVRSVEVKAWVVMVLPPAWRKNRKDKGGRKGRYDYTATALPHYSLQDWV